MSKVEEPKYLIRSRLSGTDRRFTESGRGFHTEYEIHIDEHGHKTLHATGETNLYAKIQESLEGTLIENILDRVRLGDKEALERVQGKYIDMEKLPKSLMEAQNKIIEIKNEFYKLPVDMRAKFDNSPEKYVQMFGTQEWKDIIIPKQEPIITEPIKESEAKKDE